MVVGISTALVLIHEDNPLVSKPLEIRVDPLIVILPGVLHQVL